MTIHAMSRPLNGDDSAARCKQAGPRPRRSPARKNVGWGVALCLLLTLTPCAAATLIDSADRRVDVPAEVTRVVPAGAPAQVLLEALAPAKLAGLVEPFKPEHAIYVDPNLSQLPQIPQLARSDAPGDIAAVAALNPGLVVDYGNVSARFVAADEKIAQELHVATLLYGGGLGEAGTVARTLGEALGVGPRGATLAAIAADVLVRAKPLSTLADADRVPVYIARGRTG